MTVAKRSRSDAATSEPADQQVEKTEGTYSSTGEVARRQFARFRNAWLDQVVEDFELPAQAFKLAWHILKDCSRTLATRGDVYSFRGQESFAALLGIEDRQVRVLVKKLEARGHVMTKRGGKGNPNQTHPTLFDRQKNAGQENPLTGTSAHFDRHSNVVLTGEKMPAILSEDTSQDIPSSSGGPLAPPLSSEASSASSTVVETRKRSLAPERSLSSGPSRKYKVGQPIEHNGDPYTITKVGKGSIEVRNEWGNSQLFHLDADGEIYDDQDCPF